MILIRMEVILVLKVGVEAGEKEEIEREGREGKGKEGAAKT